MIAGIDQSRRVGLGAREGTGGQGHIADRGRHYLAKEEIAQREMVEVEGRGVLAAIAMIAVVAEADLRLRPRDVRFEMLGVTTPHGGGGDTWNPKSSRLKCE